jgi:hypothetical protein
MVTLKGILDNFYAATRLTINFHKSTFVTMHVPTEDVAAMETILGVEHPASLRSTWAWRSPLTSFGSLTVPS